VAPAAEAREALAEETARRVLASAKYRHLDGGFVRRVAGEAADRFSDRNQALKYARRKLHQAFGAYLAEPPARAVTGCIDAVLAGSVDLRAACLSAMRAHASTAERVDHLVPLYQRVAAWCGPVTSVADLACGLNPLAIPWMQLAPGASYWCCEIDHQLVAALARLGEILPVELTSRTRDLVADPPGVKAHVALLLKTVTTLEQQRAGAANRLLHALDCEHLMLSLPRRSLSGRRGYADDPTSTLERVVAGTRYRLQDRAGFGGELLHHLVAPGAAS
jgi:16S rRNA (guanine(1405)-N(7))-methyltransferase